jgi:hypothetical protein
MDGVSLAASLTQPALCPELDAYYETGIWVTAIPGLPENHLRYPDLLELMEVPDHDSGTLGLKLRYHEIIMTAKDRMIRRGPWKLVSQPLAGEVRTMLFNVDEDPGCTRNCSAEFPEISARLGRALPWIGSSEIELREIRRYVTSKPISVQGGQFSCLRTPLRFRPHPPDGMVPPIV